MQVRKLKNLFFYLVFSLFLLFWFKIIHFAWFLDSFASIGNSNEENTNFISVNIVDKSNTFITAPNKQSSEDLLLFWSHRWGKDSWPPEGHKFGKCTVTYDRKKMLLSKAIIFHFASLVDLDFPWKYPRLENQLYVWWNGEAPFSVYQELKLSGSPLHLYEKNFFNWTMSYKLDSDVWWGYGYCGGEVFDVSFGKHVVTKIVSLKTELALWVTSNCGGSNTVNKRMNYVEEMIAHGANITRRGACFQSRVSPEEQLELTQIHKFYLAFENSQHCRDYITEKFWINSLRHGAVPVVFGPLKEDLLKVAPPNSFIFVEDFKSPKKLTEYLLFLDKHEEEYVKYFQWRENESETREYCIKQIKEDHPHIELQDPAVTLCDKVLANNEKKVLESLDDFIKADETQECLQYNDVNNKSR